MHEPLNFFQGATHGRLIDAKFASNFRLTGNLCHYGTVEFARLERRKRIRRFACRRLCVPRAAQIEVKNLALGWIESGP